MVVGDGRRVVGKQTHSRGCQRRRRPCRTMPRAPAAAAPRLGRELSRVNEHGHANRDLPRHVPGQHQASPSRTSQVARPSGGSVATRLPSTFGPSGAEHSNNEQCQCSSRVCRADGRQHEHGQKLEAAAAAVAVQRTSARTICRVVCCFVASLLLPRPRSIRRGQKHRLVRRDAPLLCCCSPRGWEFAQPRARFAPDSLRSAAAPSAARYCVLRQSTQNIPACWMAAFPHSSGCSLRWMTWSFT